MHYPSLIQPGRLRIGVDFYLWIPDGVKKPPVGDRAPARFWVGASRGGPKAADDLHWQGTGPQVELAFLGSMYEPRREINCRFGGVIPETDQTTVFPECLEHFAAASSHPELKTAPWCLWGALRRRLLGARLVQARHPERVVAIWFPFGHGPFGYLGQGGDRGSETPQGRLRNSDDRQPGPERGKTTPVSPRPGMACVTCEPPISSEGPCSSSLLPGPRTAHQCGDSRYMAIPFFDFWLEHRLPQIGRPVGPLRPAAPAVALWGEHMAGKLAEYIKTGAVSDTTPPPAPRGSR
ncbi:MAG: hypothetical protein CM1200mP2_51040 [Planctomycetaceae bacterium]|nr:MAG: hypothetical protein CM1200mP2_51040 [Planctomycetaceae bacterium]